MSKGLVLVLLAAVAGGLVFGVGRASAWQKDPDTSAANVTSVIAQLLAPDETTGAADTTDAGIGTDAVGMEGDSLTAPPADPADADPGHTYYVGACKPTIYTTIQAAVDASGPGDTVKVCPGTYPEQVRISGHGHDKLKLESVKPLQAVIQWPTTETAPLALVDFNTADNVTLRGFTITGPFTFGACSPERHEGVLVENASGEHIHHNHITQIENSVPALRGCQEGDAVAIGHRVGTCSGTVSGSAEVDHNVIDEYQKNGVQIFNAGSSADVDHNEITGPAGTVQPHAASNGVVLLCGAAATIDHNKITGNNFTGPFTVATSGGVIAAQAPAGSSSVDHNKIVGNDYGIESDTQNGLEISHNDVLQSLTDGIVLCGDATQGCAGAATNIDVRKNKVEDNGGSGILLQSAVSNLLKDNKIEDNGTAGGDTTDGIRVDSSSSNNNIISNDLDGNVTHDCHDDSTGTASGGTANTWKSDKGDTQNRPGLCKP